MYSKIAQKLTNIWAAFSRKIVTKNRPKIGLRYHGLDNSHPLMD